MLEKYVHSDIVSSVYVLYTDITGSNEARRSRAEGHHGDVRAGTQAYREYVERFNRLALECANRGQDSVTLEQRDALGPYPKGIPQQWLRRMPDVKSISPSTILIHRSHLDRALPQFCQVRIDGAEGRWYACPVGFQEYSGITRDEIDGRVPAALA